MSIKIKGITVIDNNYDAEHFASIANKDMNWRLASQSNGGTLYLMGTTPTIEMIANNSTPFIDFITGMDGSSGDFDMRIIVTDNDTMEISGGNLLINGSLEIDESLEVGNDVEIKDKLDVEGTTTIPKMKGRGFARPFSMKMSGNFLFEQQDGDWALITDDEDYWVAEFDGTVEAGYGCQQNGYKVPEDGIYQFGFNLNTTEMSNMHDSMNIKMDGSSYQSRTWDHDLNDMYDISAMETGDTEGHTFQGQCLLRCDRGDLIQLYYTTHNSGTGHINAGMSSNFWGMMVAPGNGKESQVSEGGH